MKSHHPKSDATIRHKSNSKGRRHRGVVFLACCGLCVLLGLSLATFKVSAEDAEYYDEEDEIDRPISELITGFSLPPSKFTPYTSTVQYSEEKNSTTRFADALSRLTHFIFDSIITSNSSFPPGYIDVVDEDTFILGSKVERNDWRDLLRHYWLAILWVVFLLCLIIIMPFVAICYCCFCCCRRCPTGCPPCDTQVDFHKRILLGFILALLLCALLFGIIVAFFSNYLMASGFQYTSDTMQRGRNDTCKFLKDVSAHLKHLFIYNYEELDNHLDNTLSYAQQDIYVDLMDVSGGNSIYELERIFKNLPEAESIMQDVVDLIKEMRFIGAQLRDNVRSIRRDINYACAILCGNRDCMNFLTSSEIETIDNSRCLHFDQIPDGVIYHDAIKQLHDNLSLLELPDDVHSKLNVVYKHIDNGLYPIVAPLLDDIDEGKYVYASELVKLREVIDTIIVSIHNHTVRSTKSFEDVEDKYGASRYAVNMFVCVMLTIILVVFIIALIWGCAGYSRHNIEDRWCNKGTAAWWLLFGILLIFCIFSLLVLVGLFYFIMGMVTYQGVCAPLRDLGENEFFRQLDSRLNMRRLLISGEPDPEKPSTPLRMSKAITACQANQSVFNLIKDHNLFDINESVRQEIIKDHPMPNETVFPSNFSEFVLLFNEDSDALELLANGTLAKFSSHLFTEHMCTPFTPVDLPDIAKKLRSLQSGLTGLWGYYDFSKIALQDAAFNLDNCHEKFVTRLTYTMEDLKEKLFKLDRLILFNYMPFGQGIQVISNDVLKAEKFISERGESFVDELRKNVSVYVQAEVASYMEMVIRACHEEVGNCAPIAYIYYRGVDHICNRLVDPLNAFWVGLILCALLLIAILFVAHRLLCLYNKVYPQSVVAAPAGGCPVCSARTFALPLHSAIYTHAVSYCECNERTFNETLAKEAAAEVAAAAEPPPPPPSPSAPPPPPPPPVTIAAEATNRTEPELSFSSSKHKQE